MQRTGDFTPAVTYSLPCTAGSGNVGPQMEPLLGATGQPALGHVSQAASGWCVRWKASVGPKGEGVGEARETRPPPTSASGGRSGSSCRQALSVPASSADLDFHNFISSLCLPPQGGSSFLPISTPPSSVEIIPRMEPCLL